MSIETPTATRLSDAFPASDDSGESQIKTRRMNLDSREPFDPEKNKPQRRVQQSKDEPKQDHEPPKDDADTKKPAAKKEDKAEDDTKDPAVKHFAKRLFGDRFAERLAKGPDDKAKGDSKKKDGDKPAPAAKAADKKPEDTKKADDAKPKGITVTKAPRQGLSQDDVRTIAETAATAAITASRASKDDAAATKKQEDDPAKDLAIEDRRNFEIAKYMAKDDRYSDLPEKMLDVARRKKAYREEWQKENPGEKFSWDDDSHTNFLEQITPEFDENDFEDARIEMRAEKVAERKLEGANSRIRDLEQKAVGAGLRDSIEKESKAALRGLAEDLAPNADWDLSSEDGLSTVAEKEDVLGEIVSRYAPMLKEVTAEAVKFYDSDGKVVPDPKGNETHRWMIDTVEMYEQKVVRLPEEQRVNDKGQSFLARSEYYKLTPDRRARHWTIAREQVLWIMKDAVTLMAKKERDREVAKLKRYAEAHDIEFDEDAIVSLRKNAAAENDDDTPPKKTPVKSGDTDDDSPPPSIGDGNKVDTSGAKGKDSTSDLAKRIVNRIFQRAGDKA